MKKIHILILVSIIFVVALTLVLFWGGGRDRKTIENIDAVIEAQETRSLSANGKSVKQNLITSLRGQAGVLLTTESMEIGYLPPPDERIMVFILGKSVEQVESEAINWLLSRGFSKADLCALPVVFSIDNPEAVAEEYKLSTNYLPPYCL